MASGCDRNLALVILIVVGDTWAYEVTQRTHDGQICFTRSFHALDTLFSAERYSRSETPSVISISAAWNWRKSNLEYSVRDRRRGNHTRCETLDHRDARWSSRSSPHRRSCLVQFVDGDLTASDVNGMSPVVLSLIKTSQQLLQPSSKHQRTSKAIG